MDAIDDDGLSDESVEPGLEDYDEDGDFWKDAEEEEEEELDYNNDDRLTFRTGDSLHTLGGHWDSNNDDD